MTEKEEEVWVLGERAAYRRVMEICSKELEPTGRTLESFISERELTVRALRAVCEYYGDNDWPTDLHLADVVEKHLQRHLDLLKLGLRG